MLPAGVESKVEQYLKKNCLVTSAQCYFLYGQAKELKVKEEGPVINIFEIHTHPFFKWNVVSAAYLPNASQSMRQAPRLRYLAGQVPRHNHMRQTG